MKADDEVDDGDSMAAYNEGDTGMLYTINLLYVLLPQNAVYLLVIFLWLRKCCSIFFLQLVLSALILFFIFFSVQFQKLIQTHKRYERRWFIHWSIWTKRTKPRFTSVCNTCVEI